MLGKRKGQSTLEYIIIFTAIVAGILLFAYSTIKPAVQSVLNASADKIINATANFSN